MAEATHELFHELADPDSAGIRILVVALGLKERVAFRNVAYPEAAADLVRRGGDRVPSLWDGTRLLVGSEPVRAALADLAATASADRRG